MDKGYVIYEKLGKTYTISDKRFLFLSKKGFSKVVCVPAGHVIHIYIDDETISNIKFIDCNFDVFDFGIMSIFIHILSQNTQVHIDKINYNKCQELFVKSQNMIVARNISDGRLLSLKGESILVSSLKDIGLEINGINVSITNYCSRGNHTFNVKATQNLTLDNVSVISEYNKIEIDTTMLRYSNTSLISSRTYINGELTKSEYVDSFPTIMDIEPPKQKQKIEEHKK